MPEMAVFFMPFLTKKIDILITNKAIEVCYYSTLSGFYKSRDF